MCFYLGTHQPAWLERTDVPLFINRRRLVKRKKMPRALGRWALDSGAFSEITIHGEWSIGAVQYAAEVRRIATEIGGMLWAAIQDWMCEPHMLAKTGLSVREHQARTVQSLLNLRTIAPEIPWVPVLQGWQLGDYLDHVEMYMRAGVELDREPLVGLGSVCRRQATAEFVTIVNVLASLGLRIHGFGVKTQGLEKVVDLLASSDSMAWSRDARWMDGPALPECQGKNHRNCANCIAYALDWRRRLLERLPSSWQTAPAAHVATQPDDLRSAPRST